MVVYYDFALPVDIEAKLNELPLKVELQIPTLGGQSLCSWADFYQNLVEQ